MTATAIEREFAGSVRVFNLRNDNSPTGLVYEAEGMTLADLARRASRNQLGSGDVRHVLVHGLCQGRMRNLMAAQDLVDAEMNERGLLDFLPLATEIVERAFAGQQA